MLCALLMVACGVPTEEHEAVVAARDAIIAERDGTIYGLNTTVTQLNAVVSRHERTIADKNTLISSLEGDIGGLKATVARRDETLTLLGARVSRHERIIREKDRLIAEKDDDIADMEATIAEKDTLISTLDSDISDLETTLSEQSETISQQLTRITAVSAQLNVQEGLPDSIGEIEDFVKMIDERNDTHTEARYYNFESLSLGQVSLYEYHRELSRINSADRLDNELLNLAQLKIGLLLATEEPDNHEVSKWVGPYTQLTLDDVLHDREAVLGGFDELAEIQHLSVTEIRRMRWAFNQGEVSRDQLESVEVEQYDLYDGAEAERRFIWLLIGFAEGLNGPGN